MNLYNLNANVKTYKYVLDVGCSLVVAVDSFCWGSRRRKRFTLFGGYFLIHSFCVIGVAISYFCFHFSEMITRTKKATTKQVRG